MIEWFDDVRVGMRFKSSEKLVTREDIKRSAAEFDPQPYHLDEAAAEQSLFKGLAASGWHTAAMPMGYRMPTESDVRMAKFKAAMKQCREGDVSALIGCDITPAELMTISALAKAAGDAVTFGLAQRFLNTWSRLRRAEEGGDS